MGLTRCYKTEVFLHLFIICLNRKAADNFEQHFIIDVQRLRCCWRRTLRRSAFHHLFSVCYNIMTSMYFNRRTFNLMNATETVV